MIRSERSDEGGVKPFQPGLDKLLGHSDSVIRLIALICCRILSVSREKGCMQ